MLTTLVQNNINFKAIELQKVNLKRAAGAQGEAYVRAALSMLNPDDAADVKTIERINNSWVRMLFYNPVGFDSFGEKGSQCYAIELQEQILDDKLAGLFKTVSKGDKLLLSKILTNPEIKHDAAKREVKGAGEVMFGAVSYIAQRTGVNALRFISSNTSFFGRILGKAGIDISKEARFDRGTFTLYKSDFDKYVRHCEENFNFKFDFVV